MFRPEFPLDICVAGSDHDKSLAKCLWQGEYDSGLLIQGQRACHLHIILRAHICVHVANSADMLHAGWAWCVSVAVFERFQVSALLWFPKDSFEPSRFYPEPLSIVNSRNFLVLQFLYNASRISHL